MERGMGRGMGKGRRRKKDKKKTCRRKWWFRGRGDRGTDGVMMWSGGEGQWYSQVGETVKLLNLCNTGIP